MAPVEMKDSVVSSAADGPKCSRLEAPGGENCKQKDEEQKLTKTNEQTKKTTTSGNILS